MSRWRTFSLPCALPDGIAVYVLYIGDRPSYVGQTTGLYQRLAVHRKQLGALLTKIKISRNRRYGEHAMRELRLIGKLRPAGNIFHRTGASRPWARRWLKVAA